MLATAGNVFLKFCKLLHIKLDPIDPSLYIHRFASMLEFSDKTQQVWSSIHDSKDKYVLINSR